MQLAGNLPCSSSPIPRLPCTREIAGDEVYYAGSIARDGTNQELHLVDSRIVGFKPKSLDHAGAAAIPLTALSLGVALRPHAHRPRRHSEG